MMSSRLDSFVSSGASPTEIGPDFRCENHGSIFLLHPLGESAQSWIAENLPSDVQWFGRAVAIEHRFIWPILEGIQNDGLAVPKPVIGLSSTRNLFLFVPVNTREQTPPRRLGPLGRESIHK
jgi:hypothetical protein